MTADTFHPIRVDRDRGHTITANRDAFNVRSAAGIAVQLSKLMLSVTYVATMSDVADATARRQELKLYIVGGYCLNRRAKQSFVVLGSTKPSGKGPLYEVHYRAGRPIMIRRCMDVMQD